MKKLIVFVKENRTGFKVVSMILVLTLMIQTVSIAVTAITESGLSLEEVFSTDDSSETMPSIVGEVESKRDHHTKVYELADGSFYEIISNEPIHKNVDGQWEEPENNMNMPESVNEATSYCNELVESISEEQNDSGVSTFSLIMDEENSHPINDTYVIDGNGSVAEITQISKTNRLFVRIPDSLVSYSNTNQITLNQNLFVELSENSVNKQTKTGILYGYGILEDWIINDEQKLTAYRFDEESQTYLFKQVGPNSIEHETSVTDNFVFTKNDTIGCLDITEICVKWSKKLLDNNGIIIKPDNTSKTTIGNCYLTRRYIVVDAYDTDFTYHSIDMGKAGQVLVNDFTNTMTIQRNEMYYPTGKMPINLYRYFDFSKTYEDYNYAGYGSHWNYESPLIAEAPTKVAWSAFDGRTIRFEPSETDPTKWYPENGEDYTLNISVENNTNAEYDGVTIESPDNLTYTFGAAGKIKRITDTNSNYIIVSYHDESTQDYITRIENNSGYSYSFVYNNSDNETEPVQQVLTQIEYQKKTNGNYLTVCVDDVNIIMTYEYISLPNGNIALTKITYPHLEHEEGLSVEYRYDADGRLTEILDVDKRKLEISYAGDVPDYANSNATKRVDNYPSIFTLTEKVLNNEYSSDIEGSEEYLKKSSLNIKRHFTYRREFVDHFDNTETIHYNQNLKLLYYNNDNGDSYFVDYATSDGKQYVSQILSPKEIMATSESKLKNGDFEEDEDLDENYWYADIYNTLSIVEGELDGTGQKIAKFTGVIGVEQYISKYADIDGADGDVIVVGSNARAESAVPTEAHFFGIEIYKAEKVNQGEPETTDELLYRLAFDPTMDNEVQYRMGAFKLTDDTECVEIRLVYSYQNGSAEFDNALIYNASEENVTFFGPPTSDNISDGSSSSSNENNNNSPNDILSDGVNQIGTLYEYSDETNYLMGITDSNDVTTNFTYDANTGFLTEKRVKASDTPSYRGEHDLSYVVDKYSYDAMGALREVKRVVAVVPATPSDATTSDATPSDATPEDTTPEDATLEDSTTEVATPGDATQEGSEKKYETKENTTQYEYEYGKISSVSHNNATYNFNYDSYGNLKDIVAELYAVNKEGEVIETLDVTVASYDYTSDTYRNINKITYSNGYVLEYTVDENGKITSISERSNPTSESVTLYDYVYSDETGELYKINDYVSCRVMEYSDNLFTVKTLADNSEGELLYSKRIENGEEEYNVFSVEYTKTSYEPTYNNDSKTTTYSSTTTTDMGYSVEIDSYAACDYFGRLKNSSVIVSEQDVQNNGNYITSHSVENEITYFNNTDGDLTTNLLETYSSTIRGGDTESDDILNEFTTEYSYDKAGRITHIYYKQNDNSRDLKYYYEYDIAGQIVKEADFSKMTYTEYVYDYFGNVAEKKIYSGANCFEYENGEIVVASNKTPTTINFEYAAIYRDALANYKVNGVPNHITHDLYGNPYKYHRIDGDEVQTYNLEWKGNQLHTVNPAGSDSLYEYKYDDNGRRTQKIVYKNYDSNNSEAKEEEMIMDYVWDDNKIMGYRVKYLYNTISITIDTAIIYDELDYPIGLKYCTSGLTDGEDDPNLSNEDIFWFVKDGQGNIVAIFSEKSGYTIGCSYTTNGELEVNNSGDFESELNQRIEDADDFETGLLIALSSVLAIQSSTTISTDATQTTSNSFIMDIETGLYYGQNRYYSPEYGRYINVGNIEEIVDDIYNPFNSNPFVYYNNDSVNCKGTASSKTPSTKVVGIQAELSKSLTSFKDSTGIELIYDSVKDELYAYYYQEAGSYSNYKGMPRAVEMITDIFENISFSSNISLKNLALVFKMNNYVSLSYFNAETNKRFIWPTSYLGAAKVKPDGNNRYTVYGSGYQSKGICYYPVSNLGFGTKDMSVRYQKIEWESEHLKDYLLANKDNIIEAVK